ncbi:hypothetical protein K402DRAFT_84624 [Aulographum hederae CBS 113979]|uniref:Uncharacterized protein n=1 Tax=Aulographum hederae CBS 113979 TaxID=1176131 RepID=A0A6G1H0X2_9PEZI|nr:hypothetical protein K402DRAFT_84624 [Aulographum hederae CBS 113979]
MSHWPPSVLCPRDRPPRTLEIHSKASICAGYQAEQLIREDQFCHKYCKLDSSNSLKQRRRRMNTCFTYKQAELFGSRRSSRGCKSIHRHSHGPRRLSEPPKDAGAGQWTSFAGASNPHRHGQQLLAPQRPPPPSKHLTSRFGAPQWRDP